MHLVQQNLHYLQATLKTWAGELVNFSCLDFLSMNSGVDSSEWIL